MASNSSADGFVTSTQRFFDGIGKHTTAVALGLGVVVALGVAGGVMAQRREAKSEAGKNALFLAQKSYEAEMKAMAGVKPVELKDPKDPKAAKDSKDSKADEKAKQDQEAASNKRLGELAFQKLDVDSKFPESVRKYREVISQFSGTRAAHEARMDLGDLYFKHGEPAKSVPLYTDAVGSAPGGFEKALALSSLGYAEENTGKPADAVASFEKALNLGEGGIKGDVLLAIARCQDAMHDSAKARSTYDQILSQLPNTDASKTAEALKAKLQ